MPSSPPAPDLRLIALVIAALIAVLTFVAAVEAPAAAQTVQFASAPQDERFQPQQERALPPFGARTVLAPVEPPAKLPLSGGRAAR